MANSSIISSRTLALIVFSIAINMVVGQLSSMLKLPIFLDSIGTIICALLAGPWAAIFSGLATNLLWGLLTGPIAAAFAPVAMMIGLSAGLLARAGGFRTLPRVILSGVVITIALMIVAVPIRTYLFAGTTGSGADFFVAYFHAVGENLLESVAITVLGANIADKIISAIVAWLLVRRLPERVQRTFPNMAKVR
ncbi:ECF transporter S component [Providencia sp. PROV188]|jgi:energy-coupling factor transport system substrate-specific component|uniref:Energy-coupling factor transport system substrate-specific component n=2 Tax=Providencia TaxID=586 RepID=A0A4R3NMM2_9GAMM|nr:MULTISPECIES: membrane protein [Providencia]ETS99825.1 PF12822 family protein [Providencia alcalifaciens PAL-3]EUD00709.1 PF12822 family protein [Providencia alcalifaciens PAL-1]MBC5790694.1 ECF transporter S component [Providencia sp. JUb39]MBG5882360.1 ECF transporter S component [Providencia alcalifaciens]MDR2242615.1 ECF transporter S component [Providencia alcalifaciens]